MPSEIHPLVGLSKENLGWHECIDLRAGRDPVTFKEDARLRKQIPALDGLCKLVTSRSQACKSFIGKPNRGCGVAFLGQWRVGQGLPLARWTGLPLSRNLARCPLSRSSSVRGRQLTKGVNNGEKPNAIDQGE